MFKNHIHSTPTPSGTTPPGGVFYEFFGAFWSCSTLDAVLPSRCRLQNRCLELLDVLRRREFILEKINNQSRLPRNLVIYRISKTSIIMYLSMNNLGLLLKEIFKSFYLRSEMG